MPSNQPFPSLSRKVQKKVLGICAALAGLILISFGRAIHYPYVVLDDLYYLTQNEMLSAGLNWRTLHWAFTTFQTNDWQPVTWLSWIIPAQFWGLSPAVSHGINIVFHTANALLLFIVLRKVTGSLWRAAFVAALFALHPMRVESVVWAAERKDVLAGFFFMVSLFLYHRYVQKPSLLKMFWLGFSFLLGLMSKPVLVTFPVILLLLDYWPLNRFKKWDWRLLVEKTPLLLLSLFSCVMTVLAARSSFVPLETMPFPLRVINALITYGEYLKKTIVPYPLAYYYPHPMENYSGLMLGLSMLALGVMTVTAFRLRLKAPFFLMGWLWFLIMLFPTAGLIQVGKAGMADRYTYLPHIGFFIAFVWLLPQGNKRWNMFLAAAVILSWTSLSFIQTGHWKDSETLDRHTLKVTGYNPIVQGNLEYAVLEKSIENEDVDSLLNFFAESQGVKVPENSGV